MTSWPPTPLDQCIVYINTMYSKSSKISNTFLFLFANKMLVFGTESLNTLVRIANREGHEQTASSEAVWSGSALFVLAYLAGN